MSQLQKTSHPIQNSINIVNNHHEANAQQQQMQQQTQMYQQQMAHQVGINGLLNMTKQRGLMNSHQSQQITQASQNNSNNARNTQVRSQSSHHKPSSQSHYQNLQNQQQQQSQFMSNYNPNVQLQKNGKIIAQKSPVYQSQKIPSQNVIHGQNNTNGGSQSQMLISNQNQVHSISNSNNINNTVGSPNQQHNQNQVSQRQQQLQQHANTLPLSIFEIQFFQNNQHHQNQGGQNPQRLYNKNPQYHYAIHNQQAFLSHQLSLQQQQQQHMGFAVIPARGNHSQNHRNNHVGVAQNQQLMHSHLIMHQQQIKGQRIGYGNNQSSLNGMNTMPLKVGQVAGNYMGHPKNGFYYFDQPVAINGKQIGANSINSNNPRLDPKSLLQIKKGGSSILLHQQHNSELKHQIQLQNIQNKEFQSGNFAHEEQVKNQLIQEYLESQGIPAHLLNSQLAKSQYYQSMMQLGLSPPTQNQVLSFEESFQASKDSALFSAIPQSVVPKKSKIPFANAYVEDCYKFVVVPGNNSGLVRKAIERREWWIEIPPVHSLYNFKWQPVSYGIKFERLSPVKPKIGEIGNIGLQYNTFQQNQVLTSKNQQQAHQQIVQHENIQTKQMVNHVEFHHLISEKANLFHQLKASCEILKENIFDICPLTFYVEISDIEKTQQYQQNMQPFFQAYQLLEENKGKIREVEMAIQEQKLKQLSMKDQVSQEEEDTATSSQDQNSNQGNGLNLKEKDYLTQINNKYFNKESKDQKVMKFKTFNFEKRASTKVTCPMSHFNGYNLWLLKPTHLNRGRGIHVFRDLDDLNKLIKEYCSGKDEEVKVAKKVPESPAKNDREIKSNQYNLEDTQDMNDRFDNDEEDLINQEVQNELLLSSQKQKKSPKKSNSNAFKIKHNTFIIQKYIEKPLLLYQRKFDIRVWVLLTQDQDLHMFKEGYLRTSSSEFKIDLKNVDDQYVHLTNNAVQKFSEHYGQFEDGNQLGYKRFQQMLDELYPMPDQPNGEKKCHISVKEDLVPQMKELIVKSMYAVRKKIDPHRRKHCFELFGYDFILDADFNVWLIEVNTNPCIEESSELLKILLPRMIEDMLRLTMDQIFPKIKKNKVKKSTNSLNSPIKANLKARQSNLSMQQQVQSNSQQNHQRSEEQEDANNYQSNDPNFDTRKSTADGTAIDNNSDLQLKLKQSRIHPVEGYQNTENMWEKLCNIEKSDQPPPNKYPNFRSEFIISANNKQFKIKRNPLFKKVVKEMGQELSKKDTKNNGKDNLNGQRSTDENNIIDDSN